MGSANERRISIRQLFAAAGITNGAVVRVGLPAESHPTKL